jgi:hypothetical protein
MILFDDTGRRGKCNAMFGTGVLLSSMFLFMLYSCPPLCDILFVGTAFQHRCQIILAHWLSR